MCENVWQDQVDIEVLEAVASSTDALYGVESTEDQQMTIFDIQNFPKNGKYQKKFVKLIYLISRVYLTWPVYIFNFTKNKNKIFVKWCGVDRRPTNDDFRHPKPKVP